MHPPSPKGLYWSIRGEVACGEHAPSPDDPRWTHERWNAVPISAGHIKRSKYQCPHCAIDGRAVGHDGGRTQ